MANEDEKTEGERSGSRELKRQAEGFLEEVSAETLPLNPRVDGQPSW